MKLIGALPPAAMICCKSLNVVAWIVLRPTIWSRDRGPGTRPREVPSTVMLSVILATDESERLLTGTLACLVPGATAGLIKDVVLADAGSSDGTAQIAEIAGCRFLALPGPLGPRLSAAAAQARGDWLMFLRAGEEPGPGWVGEATRFIERAPDGAVAIFAPEMRPPGQGSLLGEWLASLRARGSRLRPGRGLLISKRFYRELGGHPGSVDCERALLRRIGRRRIASLRSELSARLDGG